MSSELCLYCLQHGLRFLPETGRFDTETIAKFFQLKSPKTVAEWISDYKIPHKKAGRFTIVDMAVFWAHLPSELYEELTNE